MDQKTDLIQSLSLLRVLTSKALKFFTVGKWGNENVLQKCEGKGQIKSTLKPTDYFLYCNNFQAWLECGGHLTNFLGLQNI